MGEEERIINEYMEKLPEKVLPYQREGIRYALMKSGRVLFGDEMGLGKSLQALFTLEFYREREEGPCLIICPSSLRFNWKDQVEQWLDLDKMDVLVVISKKSIPHPQTKIIIISYDLLRIHKNIFSKRSDGKSWDIVIVDECHYIKNF